MWRFDRTSFTFLVKTAPLLFLLLVFTALIGEPVRAGQADQKLSVVMLMDASGSMRKNDPEKLWMAAAQTVIAVLGEEDEIAVVEFSGDTRVLSGSDSSPWLKANNRDALFEAISGVANTGGFTDFRAGLEAAESVFEDIHDTRRKLILMLTDGVLEPNPLDPVYAPFHLQYRAGIVGKSRPERNEIYSSEFKSRLTPIARRMLADEILPRLREKQIEIFTVGLGEAVERPFMEYLTAETSRQETERHAFFAETPPDLLKVFTGILAYWSDQLLLRVDQGSGEQATARSLFIDGMIENPIHVAVLPQAGEYFVRSESGVDEPVVPGTHSLLRMYEVTGLTPGTWQYGMSSGQGVVNSAWVGANQLSIDVMGLKPYYEYGDQVSVRIVLSVPAGTSLESVSSATRLTAELSGLSMPAGRTGIELSRGGAGEFLFEYDPSVAGAYNLTFIAESTGQASGRFLPRRTIDYYFEVKPRFYVTPDRISFGDVEAGDTLSAELILHYGLDHHGVVELGGSLSNARLVGDDSVRSAQIPSIPNRRISVEPGSRETVKLEIAVPEDALWGDYEGVIQLSAGANHKGSVQVRFHIPSLWEMIRLPLLLFLLFIILLVAYLVYVWGYLGTPKGVLIPVPTKSSLVLDSIRLARVKRGFFTKLLNWRKNRLTMGSRRSDIRLDFLPPDQKAELSFFRFLGAYISNTSEPDSERFIEVMEEGSVPIRVRPGRSLRLKNNCEITLSEDYTYRFNEGS